MIFIIRGRTGLLVLSFSRSLRTSWPAHSWPHLCHLATKGSSQSVSECCRVVRCSRDNHCCLSDMRSSFALCFLASVLMLASTIHCRIVPVTFPNGTTGLIVKQYPPCNGCGTDSNYYYFSSTTAVCCTFDPRHYRNQTAAGVVFSFEGEDGSIFGCDDLNGVSWLHRLGY